MAKVKLVPLFKSIPLRGAQGEIVPGEFRKVKISVPENDVEKFLDDPRFSKAEGNQKDEKPEKPAKPAKAEGNQKDESGKE